MEGAGRRQKKVAFLFCIFVLSFCLVPGSSGSAIERGRKLTVSEWGSLLTTTWSSTHVREAWLTRTALLTGTAAADALDDDITDVQRATSLEAEELELWLEQSSADWLYAVSSYTESTERVVKLIGSSAHHLSAPGTEATDWVLAFLSRETVEKLRGSIDVAHVQAVPQTLKVEPFHLGAKLSSLLGYPSSSDRDPFLEQPEVLKAVLADGAFSSLEEVQVAASAWQDVLQSSAIEPVNELEIDSSGPGEALGSVSCSAEDTDAIICGPVSAAKLRSATEWLSGRPETLALEIKKPFKLLNKWAKLVTQSTAGASTPIFASGLLGQGEVIGLADTGLEMNHCFFSDDDRPTPFNQIDPLHRKVVQYITFDDRSDGGAGGHGTHVAGTLAGNTFVGLHPYAGMAPAAKIAFFDMGYGTADTLAAPASLRKNLFPFAYKAGARVHSNSWGATVEGYGSDARDVDDYAYKNEDFVIVFAAGNDGDNGTFTIASPGNAKNCLTVGASLNSLAAFQQENPGLRFGQEVDPDTVAPFSSRGPTADGRIKPDLVAPGMPIFSSYGQPGVTAASDCQMGSQQGTSVATPVVAGLAALVRQYFREGYYPSGVPTLASSLNPSAALVKAMLIQSAVPLTQYLDPSSNLRQLGPPPDPIQGFGRPVLETVLRFSSANSSAQPVATFVRNGRSDGSLLSRGQAHSYSITVRSSKQALRATLVWMDPAAAPNSLFPMINDLDLQILDPIGTTWYSNGRSSPDTSNNVEQITVKTPSAGVYSLVVAGSSVSVGPQPYALVVSGDFAPVGPPSLGTAPTRNRANAQLDNGASTRWLGRTSALLVAVVTSLTVLGLS